MTNEINLQKHKRQNMQNQKKVCKCKVLDWDVDDTPSGFDSFNLIKNLKEYLGDKLDIVWSEEPDFVFYGPYGYNAAKYDCVRICFSGENVRVNWNIADYAIDWDFALMGDRYLRQIYRTHTNKNDKKYFSWDIMAIKNKHLEQNLGSMRQKFCSFLVSNAVNFTYSPRDAFFNFLCSYKKVDSGGRHLNNIGEIVGKNREAMSKEGGFYKSKIEWMKQYKFNLCFENASYPGYCTEKLFNALEAGCIPIYWGDTSLRWGVGRNGRAPRNVGSEIDTRVPILAYEPEFILNPKAFINAHNFSSWGDLLEEIKRIDNDDEAYWEMRRAPAFLKEPRDSWVDGRELWDFIGYILSQDPKDAKRRGVGQFIAYHPRAQKIMADIWENVAYRSIFV